MHRNSLLRSTPLRRKKRMNQKRAKPRRSGRVMDWSYLQAVRELPCLLQDVGGCIGATEADHAGERPLGRKASDDTAIPLCRLHHWARTDYSGPFYGLDARGMRLVLVTAIAETRARLGRAA